jgi:uncharacterized protein
MNNPFFENIVLFIRMLRQAGLPVSLEQSIEFSRALRLIDIGSRDQVFHAARCLLVKRHEHLRLFETLFNRFWRGDMSPLRHKAPRVRRPMPREGLATLMAIKAEGQAAETPDQNKIYSDLEVLRSKAFAHMTSDELDAMLRLIQQMRWQVSLRRTRRWMNDPKGSILNRRNVMRSAVRYGGVPLYLSWQNRKIKQRPLVLIADISGSMEKYTRLLLQFFHSVYHNLKQVECFVFGTRLTRITGQLKLKNIDLAIEEASTEVLDWAGGTRIGDSLRTFNLQWGRRVLRRGAVVLLISDGWDRGDAETLKREMRYLQHRCYRLIWLNPLLANESYQPLVEGMSAALPFIHHFLPCHNLQSLEELGHTLATLDKSSSTPRQGALAPLALRDK